MNVLKTPSFFRPSSRPSSPAPTPNFPMHSETAQVPGADRFARPHSKFMSTLRRPPPSPTVPARTASTPLVQDGSYLEMLSLKLSEAVSKALAQPLGSVASYELVAGRRPLPQGRGHALGTLIASYVFHNPLFDHVLISFQRIKSKSRQPSPVPCSPTVPTPATLSVTHQLICPLAAATLISTLSLICTNSSKPESDPHTTSCSRNCYIFTRTS